MGIILTTTKNKISYKITTPPVVEPISLDEFKLFARIDGTEEDSITEPMIRGARELTENYLGRALLSQTITLIMDVWPSIRIELPKPPLISITGIYTVDEDDVNTPYGSGYYYVDTISTPGAVILKTDVTEPINENRNYGGYKIIYKAGYGTKTTDIPQPIIEGIKIWAASVYENRIFASEPPAEAAKLLNLYRIPRI